jgi:hypothetical protein
MIAAVDGQHTDVKIVQNDFKAEVLESDAFDQVEESGMILKNFDAPQQTVIGIENRRFNLGQAA